jgi:ElaB/YqjD/DUF883 family membrane-anchored ribosome-binding protein
MTKKYYEEEPKDESVNDIQRIIDGMASNLSSMAGQIDQLCHTLRRDILTPAQKLQSQLEEDSTKTVPNRQKV